MLTVLQAAHVDTVVDVRISPCPSNNSPESNYGPRDWNLLADGAGVDGHLGSIGIGYLWLVELGNPQKSGKLTTVLRQHLAEPKRAWPVHRGLAVLKARIDAGDTCCLLCACTNYDECHRKLIAEALRDQFYGGDLKIVDLR